MRWLVSVVVVTVFYHLAAHAQSAGAWASPYTAASYESQLDTNIQMHFQDEDCGDGDGQCDRLHPSPSAHHWSHCRTVINAARETLGLSALPVKVVLTDEGPRGYYSEGVISIRRDAHCSVLVHELVHHTQFLRSGSARSATEWLQREVDAKRVEHLFREMER